jgi:hypothetical protein
MGVRFSLSPERRSMLARVGSAVLLAVTLVYVFLIGSELVQQAQNWPTLHRDRDFPSYYLAAQRLLRGADIYGGYREEAARTLGIADYFIDTAVTPPTFAVVTIPLAFFPYPVAWGIWQVLSLVALGLSLFLAVREARLRYSWVGWAALGCVVLLFPPLTFHLLYAHTELFVLLLLTGAWLAFRRGREVPAGILIGLAGAIRVYPLFLLVFLLQRRSWKALLAALGSGLGLAALAAVMAGPSSYLRYLEVLRSEVPKLYPLQGNCSLWGTMHKVAVLWPALGAQPLVRDILAAAFSLGIVLLTLWLARRQAPTLPALDRAYGLYIAGALLASPLSWIYYQVLLYLPAVFLLAAPWRGKHPRALPALLLVTLLTALAPLVGGQPGLPAGLRLALDFFPTLTTVGVYVALCLPLPPSP